MFFSDWLHDVSRTAIYISERKLFARWSTQRLENETDNRAIIFPERVTTQNYRMYELPWHFDRRTHKCAILECKTKGIITILCQNCTSTVAETVARYRVCLFLCGQEQMSRALTVPLTQQFLFCKSHFVTPSAVRHSILFLFPHDK